MDDLNSDEMEKVSKCLNILSYRKILKDKNNLQAFLDYYRNLLVKISKQSSMELYSKILILRKHLAKLKKQDIRGIEEFAAKIDQLEKDFSLEIGCDKWWEVAPKIVPIPKLEIVISDLAARKFWAKMASIGYTEGVTAKTLLKRYSFAVKDLNSEEDDISDDDLNFEGQITNRDCIEYLIDLGYNNKKFLDRVFEIDQKLRDWNLPTVDMSENFKKKFPKEKFWWRYLRRIRND